MHQNESRKHNFRTLTDGTWWVQLLIAVALCPAEVEGAPFVLPHVKFDSSEGASFTPLSTHVPVVHLESVARALRSAQSGIKAQATITVARSSSNNTSPVSTLC